MTKSLWLLPILLCSLLACAGSSTSQAKSSTPPAPVDILNFSVLSSKVAGGGAVSAAQVAELPAKGYTTIINLQFPTEDGVAAEIAAAQNAGLQYVSIPVDSSSFTYEDGKQVADAIAASEGHVLLHCRSGGRVSAVWAISRAIEEGLSPEEAARVAAEEGCRPIPESMVERVRSEVADH